MSRSPTILTTACDFAGVSILCAAAAIALYALVQPAGAAGLSEPRYDAYDGPVPPAWIACRPDVRRYCPRVVAGGGRILSCLAGNKDRLTYDCREALVRAWTYRR